MLTIALCVFLLGAAAPAAEHSPQIRIHGNHLLSEEIYRAIVYLPPGAAADQATANVVVRQLFSFLYRSGFVLASVKAHPTDDAIDVNIDEGRLDKIVFIGASSLMTLRLKLELDLPNHIFNQSSLRRQLKQFGEKYGFHDLTYRLVPTSPIDHEGPQLSNLWTVQGYDMLPPQSHYELWITVGNKEWGTGLGINLTYDFPDGLEPGVSYQSESLLFDRDRWQVSADIGGKLRSHLGTTQTYPVLSRFITEGRYYAPPLFGISLRPFIWLVSDLVSRQRADLGIDIYYSERLEGSLNLGYDIVPGLLVFAGGGVDQRYFFGLTQTKDATVVSLPNQFRPFVLGRLESLFNPNEVRRDNRHVFWVEERHYWSTPGGQLDRLSLYYQKVFNIGWNDLRLKTRGVWLWGSGVEFDDEEPVGGRYIRGVFGDRYYVRRVANLSLEFRLSISRDVYKVSVFHDLAVFGGLDEERKETAMAADSFGLGFHVLILDLFQLDLYYALGFDSHKNFDHGIAVSLTNVF
jgi:Surface antigen variable number repeat.